MPEFWRKIQAINKRKLNDCQKAIDIFKIITY